MNNALKELTHKCVPSVQLQEETAEEPLVRTGVLCILRVASVHVHTCVVLSAECLLVYTCTQGLASVS